MDGLFYDNFKKYMAANKSQFLNTNRKFANAAVGTALKMIGREMIGPWFLVPLLLMLGVLYFIQPISDEFSEWTLGTQLLYFMLFFIYYTVTRGSKKNLFSVTDKLLFWGWIVIYLGNSLLMHGRYATDYKFAISAFLLAFSIALISGFHKLISKYKVQYNG